MMKKNKLKKGIAGLMAVSVAATTLLAPLTAFAANRQNIHFDLGIYKTFENKTLPSLQPGSHTMVKDAYTDRNLYPADTGANGQDPSSVDAANALELPWWNGDWTGYYAKIVAGTATAGDKPTVTWNGDPFNFPGYTLVSWVESTGVTENKVNKIAKDFPYRDITYKAKYKSDGTTYKITTKYEAATGAQPPLNGNSDTVAVTRKVMVTYQAPILNVPGYKATLDDADIKIYEPNTSTPVNKHYNTVYGWTKTADQYFFGQAFNKDLEITYRYAVDTAKKFSVDAEHVILDAAGSIANVTTKRESFNAEQTITGVEPLASLITAPSGQQPRYILVTADGAGNEKAPAITAGTTANQTDHIAAFTGSLNASTYALTGSMPNQPMAVKYVYKPNPNYKLNITIRYEDEDGKRLTQDVLDAAGITNMTVTPDNAIVYELNPNTSTTAPLPDLTAKGYQATPGYSITVNALDAGAVSVSGNSLSIGMNETSYEIKVVYAKNPANWGQVLFDNDGNLTLKSAANSTDEYDPSAEPIELEKNAAGNIPLTQAVVNTFPNIVPDTGYEIEGYYVGSTKVVDENKNLIGGSYELAATNNTYKLTAKVKKNANWKDYVFTYDGGSNGSMANYPKTVSLYPMDASGNPRTIMWPDLDPTNPAPQPEFTGLVPEAFADTGYEIRWYDANDNQLDGLTDIVSYPAGSVFTAKAVSNQPTVLNQVNASGNISTTDGAAQLVVPTTGLNPDPAVWYVVTDASGNVIKKIRNTDLATAGGIISGTEILPDTEYQIYEVSPTANINVGDPITNIPSADVSVATRVRTPVAVDPQISLDPADNSKTQAVFRPVTPGMEYAVIAPDGTVFTTWTTPTGNELTVPGLDPDTNYKLVVRPAGSTDPESSRLPGMEFRTLPRAANNELRFINPADIEVLSPANLSLSNVPTGTVIRLKAKAINSNGDVFVGPSGWKAVLGTLGSTTDDGNTVIEFRMPAGLLVLQAEYSSSNANVSWEPASPSDAVGAPGSLGVINPNIGNTATGVFRVRVNRQPASPSDARAVQAVVDGNYTAMFEITVKVEKKNAAGVWEDYTDPDVEDIEVFVSTGLLSHDLRTYVMHDMVSGGAPSETAGDYQTVVNNANYAGTYSHKFVNGVKYLFGYKEPASYSIRIRNAKDNTSIAAFKAEENKSLSDYKHIYEDRVMSIAEVDRNGVTWTYVGLSSDKDTFVPYDENLMIRSDELLYAFYENDRDARNQAADNLSSLINRVKLLDANGVLQTEIAAAEAQLNKTSPRKASRAELLQALADLTTALNRLTGSNSGGSGGSSGGGGGGTTRSNTGNLPQNNGISTYTTYQVGTDGNWRLLDENKHIWKFETNNTQSVTGWANLAYTYNGVKKIETYHFGADGVMDSGWFKDEAGKWYYLSEDHDGFFGMLIRGWHKDSKDGRWYYLSTTNGAMHTGWNKIADVWYFLNPDNHVEPTWRFNETTQKWEYIGNATIRPLGSMYQNELTPDGYYVNESGAWVKEELQ